MFTLNLNEISFIGLCLEGFFYGLYSGIFAMYIQYHASKKDTNNTQKIIFYSICALYFLSVAIFVCDIASSVSHFLGQSLESRLRISYILTTSFGCSDFIAQFILIYRCWIVWGRNIHVVIIPAVSAFAFLATWLACNSSPYILSGRIVDPGWVQPMLSTSLALSLTVNALVTGLIVFRVLKVFRGVNVTSDDRILGATGGSKLRQIIFILIESGMALFSIQLVRLVITIVWVDAAQKAYNIIVGIHEILNGITPTIIVVRTSMGLSFDDEKSMEAVALGSLRFASNHPNSVSETESIEIVGQDSTDDDDTGIQ